MSEYTPTEADVRGIYVEYYMRHTGRLHSHTEAEFDAWLARVRRDAEREALRNVEVQLVGELSAGTYLADWATLTARDVREGIWHVYDRIPEETP